MKPANVMVGRYGEVVLMDWGIALRVGEEDPPRGRIVGTPYYLSPEQARGDPDDQRELSEVMRVIHFVTALATVGVFASHIAVDHID